MIAGILIIACSLVLFLYWFRYSCVLLLRNATEGTNPAQVPDEQFNVARVQNSLKTECELDPLERALERDYQVLTYLIEHAADLELASIENRLLLADYKMMRLWSRLTRTAAPEQSRRALAEMASVLGVFVSKMSEQSALHVQA
jgi:hypothetical protein